MSKLKTKVKCFPSWPFFNNKTPSQVPADRLTCCGVRAGLFFENLKGYRASQEALAVKNPPADAGEARGESSIPGSWKVPWRRHAARCSILAGRMLGQGSRVGLKGRRSLACWMVSVPTGYRIALEHSLPSGLGSSLLTIVFSLGSVSSSLPVTDYQWSSWTPLSFRLTERECLQGPPVHLEPWASALPAGHPWLPHGAWSPGGQGPPRSEHRARERQKSCLELDGNPH